MTVLQLLPILFFLGTVAAIMVTATASTLSGARAWKIAAAVAVFFIGFTALQLAHDGVLQFWRNHTNDMTGNQVWFDLNAAVALSFYLLVPRARAVGMNVVPWGVAVFTTASVALLPMFARVIWLERARRSARSR